MGRRNKERVARILAGLEPSMREKMQQAAVTVIQQKSTADQVDFMTQAMNEGRLAPNKVRKQMEQFAPLEMRKGAEKLIKQGKLVTVDNLLEEYRREKAFQKVADSVGLHEDWFIKLAEVEVRKYDGKS